MLELLFCFITLLCIMKLTLKIFVGRANEPFWRCQRALVKRKWLYVTSFLVFHTKVKVNIGLKDAVRMVTSIPSTSGPVRSNLPPVTSIVGCKHSLQSIVHAPYNEKREKKEFNVKERGKHPRGRRAL